MCIRDSPSISRITIILLSFYLQLKLKFCINILQSYYFCCLMERLIIMVIIMNRHKFFHPSSEGIQLVIISDSQKSAELEIRKRQAIVSVNRQYSPSIINSN
eukprot:TRINITY_DN9160_c0_g1_i1.p1 TRINITY_DN9160_c0_g1~~TRINITY_DN9160_c0_g1_i1.p1  ORF type:complete len:102 (+),score=4.05 TRINITY_DN9160_c0_g1_i1:112-417(+)